MADVTRLLEVVANIAKEYGYNHENVTLKPVSSGGANYTSQLFAITITSPEKEDLKLFSKVATMGEKARSISDTQVYEIEIIFYSQIVPKLRELEDKYNLTNRLVLPKYYGGVNDYAQELMVLEDVTAKGYKSFDRFKYIDWDYAAACLDELAKFHAISVAFERDDPREYADIISKLKFKASADKLSDFINKHIATAVEATDEIYRSRVELFLRNQVKNQTIMKFFDSDCKVLLAHGDFRPSNILHRNDENGKLQVIVVDYQMIKRGNPVTDLVYFLICGSGEEFRSKHLHQFFDYYYYTFSRCLRRLGIEPDTVLTKEDYREDIKEMLPFGLTLASFVLLFITVEEKEAPKPESGLDFDELHIKPSDQFKVRFNSLVRDYVNWGIL